MPPAYTSTSRTTLPATSVSAVVAAGVAVRQLRVVQAHQVQDRGVEVVDVDRLLGRA